MTHFSFSKQVFRAALKLALLFIFIGAISCRDTKKEEEETQATMAEIETVETEVEELAKEVEVQAVELEDALKELD